MAGSKLLRCDLVDGFAGVAVMQHEHAGAGTGDCGGIALGAEERNELGGRRHQGTAIRRWKFLLRGGEQQRVGLGLSGRKLVGERRFTGSARASARIGILSRAAATPDLPCWGLASTTGFIAAGSRPTRYML